MAVSEVKNFHIYRSSAGSGKTYTLTREYLKLALKHPEYYRLILAVTFTNKATEEMKSRILDSLFQLSSGTSSMSFELMEYLKLSESQLQIRAQQTLSKILHNYSSFAVTTIDSFFQKVIRSFAREVGVEGSFQVELDQQKVIDEVVEKTIAEVFENESLIQWLIEFAVYKISDGKTWEIRRDIKRLSQELFTEVFIGHRDEVFSKISDPSFLPGFMQELKKVKSNYEHQLQLMGKQAVKIWSGFGLSHLDFSNKLKGPAGFLFNLSVKNYVKPTSYTLKAHDSGVWYSKSSPSKDAIESATNSGLSGILSDALKFIEDHKQEYETASQLIRYMYTIGILGEISNQLSEYRDENELLLISDFPVFLNGIIKDGDAPYIYEKIGSKYQHYLIDEFQDTSGLQWNNFRPLVQDSIAAGKFNMVVGDLKQSIYRWRGGDWRLLLEQIQSDIGSEYTETKNLEVNWRSKKNIIDFNNSFFSHAPDMLSSQLKDQSGSEIPEIQNIKQAYIDAFQFDSTDEEDLSGLVGVSKLKPDEISTFDDLAIEQMITQIERLQDSNYKLSDIAILVRRKEEANKVTNAFRKLNGNKDKKYKYDIVSNESLFLKNSGVVRFILAAMLYIDNPDELLHQNELEYAYKVHMGRSEHTDMLELFTNPVEILKGKLNYLESYDLNDLVEEIIRIFDLSSEDDELAYVLALQDAVLDYSRLENAGIDGFLSWWEVTENRAIQISEDQDAIRLMTIHKAKGLQFKVVLVPFCNWKLDHEPIHENIVWCDSENISPYNSLPFLPLRYKSTMNDTFYSKNYWKEKASTYMDNLNLLYVAFTRAEEVLYIMYEEKKTKQNVMQDVGDLISRYFDLDSQSRLDFKEASNHKLLGEIKNYSVYTQESDHEVTLDHYISQSWFELKDLKIRSKPQWNSKVVVEKLSKGTIMHETLASICYLEDTQSAILKTKHKYGLNNTEISNIQRSIESILDDPKIKNWFDKKWKVRNEATIVLDKGKTLRPDRVIYDGDKAIIIDFKTGLEANAHLKQVKEYQLALLDMNFVDVQGYILYINNRNVVRVS